MAAGPNILKAGNPALFAHGANLGQDGRAGHPALSKDAVDAVTFNDGGHSNKQGLESASLDWTGLFTASAGRSYNVVKDMFGDSTGKATARVVSYYPEAPEASPATGTAGQEGIGLDSARVFDLNESGGPGDLLEINAAIMQDGTSEFITGMGSGSATNSATLAYADLGASSATGGNFYIHITTASAAGGNVRYTGTVEHASATNASWITATGGSFLMASGTTRGTVISTTGQLRRFVRINIVRDATTGHVNFVAGAKRL